MRGEHDSPTSEQISPAHQFHLYGWKPDPALTDDENYMDIIFLITRSAKEGQQGHMGSLIVHPSFPAPEETPTEHEDRLYQNIVGAATNTPLFGNRECTSDIHAEISALGQACRAGRSTEGGTVYITIPPCKRCFAALVAFGIKRIVTRQESPKLIRETGIATGMIIVNQSRGKNRSQMERINKLVNEGRSDEQLMEIAERNRRVRQERKQAKKENSAR